MKFSEIKQIKEFCDNNGIDWREVTENINYLESDFEVDNFRFILESDIDEIQRNELLSDYYILGCFNDWFISEHCGISLNVVQALQKTENYEALGELMADGSICDLQIEYARLDGYGHHFAHYDGNTHDDLLNLGYYVFRVN